MKYRIYLENINGQSKSSIIECKTKAEAKRYAIAQIKFIESYYGNIGISFRVDKV